MLGLTAGTGAVDIAVVLYLFGLALTPEELVWTRGGDEGLGSASVNGVGSTCG